MIFVSLKLFFIKQLHYIVHSLHFKLLTYYLHDYCLQLIFSFNVIWCSLQSTDEILATLNIKSKRVTWLIKEVIIRTNCQHVFTIHPLIDQIHYNHQCNLSVGDISIVLSGTII